MTDTRDPSAKAEQIVCDLDALPVEERVRAAMEVASQLLEYAAFEMATERSATEVSELISIAARLDTAAHRGGLDGGIGGRGRLM